MLTYPKGLFFVDCSSDVYKYKCIKYTKFSYVIFVEIRKRKEYACTFKYQYYEMNQFFFVLFRTKYYSLPWIVIVWYIFFRKKKRTNFNPIGLYHQTQIRNIYSLIDIERLYIYWYWNFIFWQNYSKSNTYIDCFTFSKMDFKFR